MAGRLNGIHAEPGTLFGPKQTTREWMVCVDNDDSGCLVGYATPAEIEAARLRLVEGLDPRSVTEARWTRSVVR